MKNPYAIGLLVLSLSSSPLLAQAIDLRGKVASRSGTALAGAVITLRKASLKDTSDGQGLFRILGKLNVAILPRHPFRTPDWRYGKGPVGWSVRSEGAALFTADGRILENQERVPTHSTPHASLLFLAKSAAVADTLEVTLPGYRTLIRSVAGYVDSLPVLYLDADGAPEVYPPVIEAGVEYTHPSRLPATAGLPIWKNSGMYLGRGTPGTGQIARSVDARTFGVIPDDGKDDTQALQKAIDASGSAPGGDINHLTVLSLPAGRIDVSCQINVSVNFLIIRGQGSDPLNPQSTRIILRPSPECRYDKVSPDGTLPGMDEMTHAGNTAKWFWPGRGGFRVQVRDVHPDYADAYAQAPANRKDIYEGSINFHWKSGLRVDQKKTFPARAGDHAISLDPSVSAAALAGIKPGTALWVGAANSQKMYLEQGVSETSYWENGHMKSGIYYVLAVDASTRTMTLDQPLEFDVPANNTSDGSPAILGAKYYSKVMPLKLVQGVGFEDFYFTLDLEGLPRLDGKGTYAFKPADAVHDYGNMAPEYAFHGIVFKWAANSWARGLQLFMSGSHPLVTEQVKGLEFSHNRIDGSWNKGKGGNGYVRLSRAWDCLVYGNILRNVRHLTLQWSTSHTVVVGNDLDCDINLHGGWERNNLIENNTVRVSAGHAPGKCRSNCGTGPSTGEGSGEDVGTWYPIYWATGAKAGKWAGATGPRNIFFNNTLLKQVQPNGPYADYLPYYAADGRLRGTLFQFGWDRENPAGSRWEALSRDGQVVADWSGSETVDFSTAPHSGVNAARKESVPSLFARDAAALADLMPHLP
ncbi:MAG: glycoside hydrolase family 55 protein [Fibrobacterota bacterium]|nr:glycoside hydrolase family 55 protein [Fibrobacterota bacterium]